MKVFVIGDVHLSTKTTSHEHFLLLSLYNYIENNNHKLIILGDYLDFWRNNNSDCLTHNAPVINKHPKDTIYLKGNHDYLESFNRYPLTLNDYNNITFTHGSEIDVAVNFEGMSYDTYLNISDRLSSNGTAMGSILSTMWNFSDYASKIWRFTRNHGDWDNDITRIEEVISSNTTYLLCPNIDKDDFIIFGHTHRQYICNYGANPGAFPDYLILDTELQTISLKTWTGEYNEKINYTNIFPDNPHGPRPHQL